MSQVVQTILQHSAHPEVLNCSLINKLWNFEAKSLLRSNRKTLARINSSTICKDLTRYAGDLEGMVVVPFTGLSITMKHRLFDFDSHQEFDEANLRLISTLIPIKFLLLKIEDGCELKAGLSNALKSIDLLVAAAAHQILELSIDMRLSDFLMIQSMINVSGFHQLQILKIDVKEDFNDSWGPFWTILGKIVSAAPSLGHIYYRTGSRKFYLQTREATFLQNLMNLLTEKGKVKLVIPELNSKVLAFPRNLFRCLAVQRSPPNKLVTDLETYETRRILLLNSQLMLTSASLDIFWVAKVIFDRIVVSQLVELEVSINFSKLSRQHPHLISLLLQKHAWRQCFPKLQNLKFGSKAEKNSEDFIQEFAAQFCAGTEEPDCKK